MHASFSPDGTHVLTCGNDRTARLWDAGTGDPLAVLRGHTTTVAPPVQPRRPEDRDCGRRRRSCAASWGCALGDARGRSARTYRCDLGCPLQPRQPADRHDQHRRQRPRVGGIHPLVVLAGHSGTVWTAAFSPSGGRVATGTVGGTTRVWDARTGRRLAVIRGGNDAVTGVGFSPDGRLLVTTNGDGNCACGNRVPASSCSTCAGTTGGRAEDTSSRDGRRVLTAGEDGTARVWDVTHGLPQIVVDIGKNAVSDLEFSRSGDSVVASSTGGTLVVRLGRHPGSCEFPAARRRRHSTQTRAAWSRSARSDSRNVRDSRSGRPLEEAEARPTAATLTDTAFARDGRTVLAVGLGETAVVWHGGDQQRATALRGDSGDLKAGAFSPDGTRVVTAGPDGALWSASSGRRLAVFRHGDTVNAAAFSPDGRTIVTAGSDGTVRLWRADGTSLAAFCAAPPDRSSRRRSATADT